MEKSEKSLFSLTRRSTK